MRAALREVVPDTTKLIKLEDLEACTYLEWTVKEMLRLHPTLPSFLERVVPPGGAMIAGYKLKPGTTVAMSAYVQHQQESLFPHPEVFDPERYVEISSPPPNISRAGKLQGTPLVRQDTDNISCARWANETEEMRLNSLAFSTGPRSCVGQK